MKQAILERYDSTAEGHVIIDIAASRLVDLYDDLPAMRPLFEET